jgi:hypothetical protein
MLESPIAMLSTGFYRPAVAVAIICILVVAVLATAFIAAKREGQWWPLVLRFVGIAGLGWVLLGYSQSAPVASGADEKPRLTILLDRSLSMAERDAVLSPENPPLSRLDAVRSVYLNRGTVERFAEVARVQTLAFDDGLVPVDPSAVVAEGDATALYRAVQQTDADVTLILSDGHDTSLRDAAVDVSAAGRLYAVPVGSARSAPDLALQAWPDSDRVFEDQSTVVTASIQQSELTGQRAVVELLLEGEAIATQTLDLQERSTTVRFDVTPPLEPGRSSQANLYTARVRLIDGDEAYRDNNAESVAIQTTRGQIRVLLLEGEPYWDTRSLARLINEHPRFDLTSVYAFGERRVVRRMGETLASGSDPVADVEAFDIVVLGKQVQRLIDRGFADRLAAFVRGGGAVVFARGRPFDDAAVASGEWDASAATLASISPVDWAGPVVGEMRVRLGASSDDPRGPLAGLEADAVLTRLPGMLAATRIDGRRAASIVLLEQADTEGQAFAAMASLRVGSGTTLAVLTEGLWRWELLPGVDEPDDTIESVYGSLWVRALQWLAAGGDFLPGQDIAIEADRSTVELNQPVKLRISTRYVEADELDLRVTVRPEDGSVQMLTPTPGTAAGVYEAAFQPEQTGRYTVALTTPGRTDLIDPSGPLTTQIVAIDRSRERRDQSAKPELLRQLVEPTGGVCLEMGDVDPVVDYLQTLQALRGRDERVDYAFHAWPVFALIAGCFGLEWIFRRRMGLR